MKLFNTNEKVGLFLDSIVHTSEKRKDRGAVKVICLTLRAQPLTYQLATAVDPKMRSALFELGGNAAPLNHIEATLFHFPIDRQMVTVYASPDTVKPSIMFDQVKVKSLRARSEADINGYALIIKAQFEQMPEQLNYAEEWRGTQRFLSFEEAEPMLGLDSEDDPEDADDEDDSSQPELAGVGAGPEKARRIPKRHAKK